MDHMIKRNPYKIIVLQALWRKANDAFQTKSSSTFTVSGKSTRRRLTTIAVGQKNFTNNTFNFISPPYPKLPTGMTIKIAKAMAIKIAITKRVFQFMLDSSLVILRSCLNRNRIIFLFPLQTVTG
jgi:hypothetical protein